MGKGDKKTKKGKRFKGSYGVSRKRKKNITTIVRKTAKPKKVAKPKEMPEGLEEQVKETTTKKAAPKKKAATKKAAPKKKTAAKKAK